MVIHTKFGNANINKDGYYQITSVKEGNVDKLLHRLIFEDFYKFKIPKQMVIHHKNGNKLDNCILNLQIMSFKNHSNYHNAGNKSAWFGKKHTLSEKEKISNSQTSTGIFRVHKGIDKNCKNGFIWRYSYWDGKKRKRIESVNIHKLKQKIIEKGLTWKILDKNKAKVILGDDI